jgi:hypothetical protein
VVSKYNPERYARDREQNRARMRDYYHRTKDARLATARDRYQNRGGREKARDRQLWTLCGISRAQYVAAESGQDGACAICGQQDGDRKLAADHDHETGFYRGLLCTKCNNGLGSFRDSPDLLRKAAEYLEAGGSSAFDLIAFVEESNGTAV